MTIPAFPSLKGLTYPAVRSPIWVTDIHISASGKRTTLARQSYPRYGYELVYSFLRADNVNVELQTLLAFFNACNGRALPFHFTDPDDGSVSAQVIGTGDGATLAFQLVRAMTGTGVSFVDPVSYPTGTPQIFDNGVLKATPADYSISVTGMVTFVVAPVAGHSLTWTGSYDWLCRFDDDSATFEKFMQLFYELKKIKFSTEKI